MRKKKEALPVGESLLFFLSQRERICVLALGPRASLPPSLPPDGRLSLPLPLSAGLLIEATLTEFRVEAGPLDFSFEPAKSPVEALVVLDDDFQTDHAPFVRIIFKTSS